MDSMIIANLHGQQQHTNSPAGQRDLLPMLVPTFSAEEYWGDEGRPTAHWHRFKMNIPYTLWLTTMNLWLTAIIKVLNYEYVLGIFKHAGAGAAPTKLQMAAYAQLAVQVADDQPTPEADGCQQHGNEQAERQLQRAC